MGKKKDNAGGGKGKGKNYEVDDDEYSVATELSEEPSVDEEKPSAVSSNKKVKKGGSKRGDGDDDRLQERTAEEEEDESTILQFTGKKKGKGKKGASARSNVGFSSSAFGLLEGNDDENDGSGVAQGTDGYVSGMENEVDNVVALAAKNNRVKAKKGSGEVSFSVAGFGDEDNGGSGLVSGEVSDEEDPVVAFSGKKKPSKSSKKGGFSAFAALDEIEDAVDGENSVYGHHSDKEDEPVIEFSGKKKSSKSGKKGGSGVASGHTSAFNGLEHVEENEDDVKEKDEDDAPITFTGKKKSSKASKKNASSSFSAALLNEEDHNDDVSLSAQESHAAGDHTGAQEDNLVVAFSGKKKPSKKKVSSVSGAVDSTSVDTPSVSVEQNDNSVSASTTKTDGSKTKPQVAEDVIEVSKNKKKKKKKGGRTAQEEEDLDKILAELGEGPPVAKPPPALPTVPPPDENVQLQPELGDGAGEKEVEEEGPVESAAAKKKKKKKEKEKEKKAGTAAPTADEKQEEFKNETKGKGLDMKFRNHVRKMRETLAKHNEAEERKKREEEEKLRKEEEERLRQEELERLAEEKKRLKKEKEKEKMLKKKQEGKLLTAKQKEEARRLEAMRKQILSSAGGLPLPGDIGALPTKRPKYQSKKSKPQPQPNGHVDMDSVQSTEETIEVKHEFASDVDLTEKERVDELQNVEKPEETEAAEENGVKEEDEDDDTEWDAKSWDDVDVKLPGKSAFSEEESESEPGHVVQKGVKSARLAKSDSGHSAGAKAPAIQRARSSEMRDSKNIEHTKSAPEVGFVHKPKRQVSRTKEASTSDDHLSKAEKDLRSPICCIMGHVDTGKTKLLDCIRGTNVQEGEAGGITQQIGATYFPAENIRERTKELKADAKLNVPGLLVIDTPGHESFTNLRSRGSGLCDIALLVVDIMHGLEPQTIESLNLLKMRNTEFIVALNKVDRLYGWKASRNAPIRKTLKQQTKDVEMEFNTRVTQVVTQFKEQGINSELYYKNKEMGETVSIVPTSAISGEGVPDLLLLLVQWAQKTMIEKLTYSNEVECTVLEVKVIEGHGTTIDVVLVNGVLHEGDQIVVCGMQGPIVTNIRALLTPHPMRELRVKGTYLHHKEIKAAQGIKITAQGLEHAIAGTGLHVVGPGDDLDDIVETAMDDMRTVMNRIDKSGEGVYVQASTLGSLEALLEFLKTPAVNIPVSGIGIGRVHKKDVVKASVMLEKKKEFATILAFDVRVTPEAGTLAEELGVKVFCADIIYHLFDQFKAYIEELKEEKKREASEEAVFPCVLKIIPDCVFNKKDPIVLGVDVVEGIAKVGTPVCVPQKEFIDIGRIASIENNHKPVDIAKKGQKVAIKIVGGNPDEQQKMFGRHFEIEDELVSRISRRSIDILKENYRNELNNEEWRLVVKLKKLFEIQ